MSVPADFGGGANDGAYYPVGLLTIAAHMKREYPLVSVTVVDLHHVALSDIAFDADIVGISASSTLNYRNVLAVAQRAKAAGAIVVLGGAHATALAENILQNRQDLVDFVVRGPGEAAFVALVEALENRRTLASVSGLWWWADGVVRHGAPHTPLWTYDAFQPLDTAVIAGGMQRYWETFRQRIDHSADAAFVVFTHFGCAYREAMARRDRDGLPRWCSYCSLDSAVSVRDAKAIVREVETLVTTTGIKPGARVHLKCYGDNVAPHVALLEELANAIATSGFWRRYDLGWTFYAQSSRLTATTADLLRAVGTRCVYIGFDSADDRVQRLNGLGTSLVSHRRAVDICRSRDIRIQAGFVMGCAGESESSLQQTLEFARELRASNVLERVNAAVLCVMPGAPAYHQLLAVEPWIAELDLLPTEELQLLWCKHFCPELGGPVEALARLRAAANELDDLSPGPHASMGFESARLIQERVHAHG